MEEVALKIMCASFCIIGIAPVITVDLVRIKKERLENGRRKK